MSSASRTQVVDVSYDDPRTGHRVWERKVQEVPYDEIQRIEGQELALYRPREARARADYRDDRDEYYGGRAYDDYHASRPRPRDQLAPIDRRYDDRYDRRRTDRRSHSRRDDRRDRDRRRRDDDYSDSDSESSRERRERRRHRRAKSEQPPKQQQQQPQQDDDSDDGGRLWYSNRSRRSAKFHEKHFDSSYDGLIAAAAGAAIGAITAREFGGQENRKWKLAGGALVGAAGFNVAENHYRVFTEEREQKRERQGKGRKDENDPGLDGPVQLGGALVANGGV